MKKVLKYVTVLGYVTIVVAILSLAALCVSWFLPQSVAYNISLILLRVLAVYLCIITCSGLFIVAEFIISRIVRAVSDSKASSDNFEQEEKDYIILPGIYDITGESKEEYVEGLSAIMELTIIEKDDNHILIKTREKNYVSYTIEEQQKLLSDYMALLNNEQISSFNIRPVVQYGWKNK